MWKSSRPLPDVEKARLAHSVDAASVAQFRSAAEAALAACPRPLRGPGESYSNVIQRLVEINTLVRVIANLRASRSHREGRWQVSAMFGGVLYRPRAKRAGGREAGDMM
jgi:hypothetical protein